MAKAVTLGDLVAIQRGTTYKSALLGLPGPILLGLASIAPNGGFRGGSLRTYGGSSPEALLVRPGELFLSLKDVTQSGDLLGSVARLPAGSPVGRLTQDTVRLDIVNGQVDPDFLYWLLLAPDYRAYCRSHATGTTNLGLPRGDFFAYPLELPSLAEQRRIAGVLGAFDDLIDTNAQLAARAQSLAVTLLEGAAERVPLSDVAEPVKSSMFRPAGAVEHYSLPAFDLGGLPELIDGSAIKSGKQRVTGPAVLISRLNPQTPRVWMAYPSGEAAASTEFVVLAGKVDVAVEEVWATCCTDSFAAEMRSRVTGTTGSHQRVDKAAIPAIEVSDPRSLRSVDREAVVSLVQEGHASRDEAARLAGVRDELLPLLMSGRVSVDEAWEAVPG